MVSYAMGTRFLFVVFSFRRMGRAKRNPSIRCDLCAMGFALLYPSYKKRRRWPGQALAMPALCRYFFGGVGHGRCGPRRPSNVLAMPSTPRSSERRPAICPPIGEPLEAEPPLV